MALVRWFPTAPFKKQVETATYATYDVTTTYKYTLGNKTYSQIGTGGTIAATVTALYNLLVAAQATEPDLAEVVFTNPSAGVLVITAGVAGRPFTGSASTSGGTGTVSDVATTANSSPSDVNNALNWLRGGSSGLPQAADDLLDDLQTVPMLWNLGSLSAISLNSYTRRLSAAHATGLPEWNQAGYAEYRPTEFAISATTWTIEVAPSDGSQSLKWNAGSVAATVTVRGSSAGSLGNEAVWWRGTNAANVLNVENASVAVAPVNANAATIVTLTANNGTVRCGSGLTHTTVNNTSSKLELNATLTTLNQKGTSAKTYVKGAAAATTLNAFEGTCFWMSSGSPGTINIGATGAMDFSLDTRARSLGGNVSVVKGSTWNDPQGTVAATVTFASLDGCDVFRDCKIVGGPGRNAALTT